MARADEPRPELPRLLGGRYRPRWVEPSAGPSVEAGEEGAPSMRARDTVLDRDLELVRVGFGASRSGERDALVSTLKARTTVLDPGLVAVHDAGEWQDDAFVVSEPIEGARALGEVLAEDPPPSVTERLRWGVSLLDAALTVDGAGLAIAPSDWEAASLDGYRAVRVRGLERAVVATEGTRAESSRALGRWLARLADVEATEPRDREAIEALSLAAREAETLTMPELRARVARISGAPDREQPLLPNVASGAGARSSLPLVLGLSFFVLAFVVMIVALALTR